MIQMNLCTRQKQTHRDFPGGPVTRTPHSQCGGPASDPSLGTSIPRDPVCSKEYLAKPNKLKKHFFFFKRMVDGG